MLKPKCFLISPIGEEESTVRAAADLVMKHIVRPPIEAAGYELVRADQIEKSGIITNQIIEAVLESDLVVADLTGRNPNVFYELALRHAVRKPLLQIIKKGEDIPFDVAAMRTIPYDLDLEGAEKAKNSIAAFLTALQKADFETESPVSMAIDLYRHEGSENSTTNQISKLRNDVGRILVEIQNSASDFSIHDLDDVMTQLQEVKSEIKALAPIHEGTSKPLLQQLLKNDEAFARYPDQVIVARVAVLLEPDLPYISTKLRNAIADDGTVDQSEILNIQSDIQGLVSELSEKSFSKEGRLNTLVNLAYSVLDKLTDDYIPF